MKKYGLFLLLASVSPSLFASFGCWRPPESHTFMFTHPARWMQPVRRSIWHTFKHDECGNPRTATQAWGIYQQSFESTCSKNYFLFNNKSELLVTGDGAPDERMRDVRAEWLGIESPNFRGILSIKPEQTQAGAMLYHNINVEHLTDHEFFKHMWISIELPVFSIKNSLNLKQFNVTNQAQGFPHNIIDAFNQNAWRFAHISPERSTIGVTDIAARIGKTYWDDGFEFTYYGGFSIPCSGSQNARYLFDPFLGNNGHFAFIAGVNMQMPLNRAHNSYEFCFYVDLEGLFLIRNNQTRTLDLVGKPWSRYLQLVKKDGPPGALIPGVNILSQSVTCRPYDFADFDTGLRIISDTLELEIGFGVWGHGSEQIKLNCKFPEIYGIAGSGSVIPVFCKPGDPCPPTTIGPNYPIPCGTAQPYPLICTDSPCPPCVTSPTASNSTIACQAPNDCEFVTIKESDLDLLSGAARHTTNYRFHAVIGYTYHGNEKDGFIGAGVYYEYPQENAALNIGAVWIKCGASY